MNSELRYMILDQSLKIEYALAKILSKIIRVEQNTSKTLSNKSSALPFKIKVDFLYDLKRISTEDYNLLILFMEIRNQLMQNVEVDSMEKVLTAINKKAKLLSLDSALAKGYVESPTEELKERYLNALLGKLEIMIVSILQSQYDMLIKDLESQIEADARMREAEANKEFVSIFIETQKVVASKFSTAFTQDENQREDIKRILEALFYKEFKQRVESKFGKLDV